MREILFRGKRLGTGEWVEGSYLKCRDYLTEEAFHIIAIDATKYPNNEICGCVEVDPATVGQYTGLTVNGKKIFEGDICRLSRVGTVAYGKITFKNGGYWFVDDGFGGLLRLCDCKTNGFNIEVIGNIHDNPELIGGAGK